MQLGTYLQQAICTHTRLMLLVYRMYHYGKKTYHEMTSGIFQKQCIVIQRIGLSWDGGRCYMWYTIIKVLLLHAHPFLRKFPKVIMFSWGGTWKVLKKLEGCWFMTITWPSVYPPLENLWSQNKNFPQEFWYLPGAIYCHSENRLELGWE